MLTELTEEFISQCQEALEQDQKRIEDWLKRKSNSSSGERFKGNDSPSLYRLIGRFNNRSDAEERLEDIKAALKRIEKRIFGICIDCEEGIDEARLLILPYVKRCSPCQKKVEDSRRR